MKWSVVIGAGLLALAVGGALASTTIRQDREFQRLLRVGDDALADGRTSVAVEAFSGAIALAPDAMVAYLKRGDTYRRRVDLPAALRDLEQAAQLEPTAPQPLELLGDVNLAMGRAAAAEAYYERFVAVDDRAPRVVYKLALARFREDQLAAAADTARQALALDGRLVEAHHLLGVVLRAQGESAAAVTALRRALEINPAFNPAREELASLYAGRGRLDEAIEQLEALAALDANRPARLVAVGLAYAETGQLDAALLTLGRAAARHPGDAGVHAALGQVWIAEAEGGGNPTALGNGLQNLQAAVAAADPSSSTLALYGHALVLSGDDGRAEGVLQQATSRVPVDPRAYRYLAEVAARLGHDALAEEASRRLARLTGADR